MLEKCDKLIEIGSRFTGEEIEKDFIYSDSVQYEFEKLYEDSARLSEEIKNNHPELHIDDLRGIRNRVAHAYESVSLNILLDTIRNDIPTLRQTILNFLQQKQ